MKRKKMTRVPSCVDKLYKFDPFATKSEINPQDIDSLFVPFEDLVDSNVESVLLNDLKKKTIGKFYGVIGNSGYGKSSILNYFLVKLANESKTKTFCIKINGFPNEIKNDPKTFLTHILKQINQRTHEFNSLGMGDKAKMQKLLANEYSFISEERSKVVMGLEAWVNVIPGLAGIKGNIGKEIETQSSIIFKESKDLQDLIEFINQLVGLIQTKGFEHVLIMIDETDFITTPEGDKLSYKHAISFFNAMMPVLAKTNSSYLFVLNAQYDNTDFRKQILGKFDRLVSIPMISKQKGIGKIIEKRTKSVCGSETIENIWESGTFDVLFKFYQKSSLRDLIMACKFSVEKAWKTGSPTISLSSVKEAILDSRKPY